MHAGPPFVAAGVVVHNKSPARDFTEGDAEGPTVELGAGEEARFRIHACADGRDHLELGVGVHVVAETAEVPTDNVPFEISVRFGDDPDTGTRGSIPFDQSLSDYSGAEPCKDGTIVSMRRSDAGTSGSISVSWIAAASVVVEGGSDEVEVVEVTIEAVP